MAATLEKWRARRSRLIAALGVAALVLTLAPAASAASYIYWWQRNMAPNVPAYDRTGPHNHTYNEIYFGYNAGWESELWEVTPAGYRHFVKYCLGNCFNAHPGYYYDHSYCANRASYTHFVNDCRDEW